MNDLLNQELRIVNVGLEIFYQSCIAQKTKVIQVDWHPPVKEDEEIDDLLSLLL